jgi:tRNA threonylcarbamoyladenosine biosynthesis protein TsaE
MLSEFLSSEEETYGCGHRLAQQMQPGQVLALVGDLGAGKTQLTKGITAGLGCVAPVSSPTFALVQEYIGGRLPVYHFDLYRLESAGELWNIGWDDYLEGNGICIVEWADKFPQALPQSARWLHLTHEAQGRRIQEISPPAP